MPRVDSPGSDERVAALEQELGDFSYIVSHDLTATFRHVKGFLGLLARDLDTTLTERQRTFVARIDGAADECQAMLDELRTYSRIQQGTLARRTCDVGDLIREARLSLEPQWPDIELEIEQAGPLGAVYVDKALVVDAVRRVLDNAVKFRRPGVPPRVQVVCLADEDEWVMRLQDNGLGVPQDQHEKVFQMFYSVQRDTPGVGAGLTICRRVFRRHDGDVRLAPSAEGACVELRLPRHAAGDA